MNQDKKIDNYTLILTPRTPAKHGHGSSVKNTYKDCTMKGTHI